MRILAAGLVFEQRSNKSEQFLPLCFTSTNCLSGTRRAKDVVFVLVCAGVDWTESGRSRRSDRGPGRCQWSCVVMENVYLQVLTGLSLDVAVGQTVALVDASGLVWSWRMFTFRC